MSIIIEYQIKDYLLWSIFVSMDNVQILSHSTLTLKEDFLQHPL